MKILFLVYHGFSEESGISKKIFSQVKGLRQNGHEVHLCYYDFDESGNRCRYVDDSVLCNYGKGRLAALRARLQLGCISRYCQEQGIEMVYARSFMNASPVLVRLFGRLRKLGTRCVTEIPTFPYDSEFKGYPLRDKLTLFIDKIFRKALAAKMQAIVTFSAETQIFGQRTIRISNGIDFETLPLHHPHKQADIHLIAVAEIHYWHGLDRLVAGLGAYYQKNPKGRQVYFHIVGWEDCRGTTSNGYASIDKVAQLHGVEPYIIHHGRLYGSSLDEVFDQCVLAIGSLGRHRSGISDIKTLKNREYAARGIPFVYSENDSDFEGEPYTFKVPADESPIDIQSLIDFAEHCYIEPADIRKSVEYLAWKFQMKTVVTAVCSSSPTLS